MTVNKSHKAAFGFGALALALVLTIGGVLGGTALRDGGSTTIEAPATTSVDTNSETSTDLPETAVAEDIDAAVRTVDPLLDTDSSTPDTTTTNTSPDTDSASPDTTAGPTEGDSDTGRIAAIARASARYTCPAGATGAPSDSDQTCAARTETTAAANQDVTYSCPAGTVASSGSGSATVCGLTEAARRVEPDTTTTSAPEPMGAPTERAKTAVAPQLPVSGYSCAESSLTPSTSAGGSVPPEPTESASIRL